MNVPSSLYILTKRYIIVHKSNFIAWALFTFLKVAEKHVCRDLSIGGKLLIQNNAQCIE